MSSSSSTSHLFVHFLPPPPPTPPIWVLTVFPLSSPPIFSLSSTPHITSFGSLFIIPLNSLPSSFRIQPVHPKSPPDLPRIITPHSLPHSHVFLVYADPTPYSNPLTIPHPSLSVPRFAPFILSTQSPNILRITHPDGHQRYLVPQKAPNTHSLCLLDQGLYRNPLTVNVDIVSKFDNVSTAIGLTVQNSFPLKIPLPNHFACHLQHTGPVQSQIPDIIAIINAQVHTNPLHVNIVHPITPTTIPPVVIESPREPLIAFCKLLAGSARDLTLHVRATDRDSNVKAVITHLGDNIYAVDAPAPVTIQMRLGNDPKWWGGQYSREMGTEVVCVQGFTRLLTLHQADLSVWYWRFGTFDDWHLWELHLWIEEHDSTEPRSFMVKGDKPLQGGVVRFDLADAWFPEGSVVRAQMLKKEVIKDGSVEGQVSVATKRDVVREWICGNVSGSIHFVQGETSVRTSPPDTSFMNCARWLRIRYRRFLPNDYDDWDLWTWDDTDPEYNRFACQKIEGSETRAWVDFDIDRANYGSGSKICLMPRKGKEKWLDKDEPVRIWNSDQLDDFESSKANHVNGNDNENDRQNAEELNPYRACKKEPKFSSSAPRFLITQSNSVVLRKLEDVGSLLQVFVDSETSIVVKTPVPIRWLSSMKDINIEVRLFTEPYDANAPSEGVTLPNGISRPLAFDSVSEISLIESKLNFRKSNVTFDEDFLVENVMVSVPGFDSATLSWQNHADWDKYMYSGPLGWEYREDRTSFRVFAPTADLVNVVLYDNPTGSNGRKVLPMRRIPEGCWKTVVYENLKGRYYKLLAEGENKRLFPGVEVIDPYSRCNTGHTGRGLIFGIEETEIYPRPDITPSNMIIYELHIRDVTISGTSGISNRGKFKGLAERGTCMKLETVNYSNENGVLTTWTQEPLPGLPSDMACMKKFSTGLDHIVQMGVNTVQLLPVQDFDNEETDDTSYKWGYMPVHFNSPDGWYASSTTSVARVTELKQLVDALHRAGLKVIMDVVYNHTAEDSNEFNLDARFSFNGIAPRYYYRTCGNTPVAHTGDSTCGRRQPHEPRCGECYSNGSGCGNEFRSESPMGRKFIIDSLKYWVTEFKVDGFRFDLLGLIDVDTLHEASKQLQSIDPNIVIYGEPWAGGLSPIRITEKGSQRSKGFGVFNNTFRDAIRGSPFGAEENFVMDGGRLSEMKGGIIGSIDDFTDKPLETINYVECHDNYTLWDHMRFYIRSRTDEIVFTENDMRRMHRLAAAIVFTSQGIPFMQAGQEMCRTKFDVENSYESPDKINMIRWETKVQEWTTVRYYRGLILLRRSFPEIFCKQTADEIHSTVVFYGDLGLFVPERCIAYRILSNVDKHYQRLFGSGLMSSEEIGEETQRWSEVVVLLNPTPSEQVFPLPGQKSDTVWIEFVDAANAGTRNLRAPIIASVPVQGRSACLLRKASKKEVLDFRVLQRLAAVADSYASYQGDDPLTEYAVGIQGAGISEELDQREALIAKRRDFEQKRKQSDDRNLYIPSSQMTEAKATEALNEFHGKSTSKESGAG